MPRSGTGSPRLRARAPRVLAAVLALAAALAAAQPALSQELPSVAPQSWMPTAYLIRHFGYPAEVHQVVTEDGYVLTTHRIPYGKGLGGFGGRKGPRGPGATARHNRTVAFINHPLLGSSELFVMRGARSLALMLADLGFDVWLGNFRGNNYNHEHVSMTVSDPSFWRFSWHENGQYDLAAMYDYILAYTGQSSLVYLGHSMGCSAQLVLLSERPQYNRLVRASFFMAPAAFFHNSRGLLEKLRRAPRRALPSTLNWLKSTVFGVPIRNSSTLNFCVSDKLRVNPVCVNYLSDVFGPLHSRDASSLGLLLKHWPLGGSLGQVIHYGQLIVSGGEFRKWDFGTRGNYARYGEPLPPTYNLRNVRAPVHIYYAENDYLVNSKDAERLAARLPNLAGIRKLNVTNFSHMDFVSEKRAYDLVYKHIANEVVRYL